MAQNIYDQADFFAGYSGLRRSMHGLEGAPEWPTVRALLPPLVGARVVDLGCGFGWFSRWAAKQGAVRVLGLDLSENMLARARAETTDATVTYEIANLDQLTLEEAAFDLAYSSLAFHYVADFEQLAATVHQALSPGGRFVFTIEHPIFMAPSKPGWTKDEDGRRIWPLDRYLVEGKRVTDWFTDGVVKYHRTLGTTLNTLIGAGFTLRHIEEWRPTDEQLAQDPAFAEELDRPMFLIVSAER